MITEHERLALVELIDHLPERERDVVNALFYERISYREIAERYEWDVSYVAQVRQRALERLARALGTTFTFFESLEVTQ